MPRALRVRSGLSYRDVALRMSRVAPRHAMAKSTLAALFAQDALPRRPGQLIVIVDVLTASGRSGWGGAGPILLFTAKMAAVPSATWLQFS